MELTLREISCRTGIDIVGNISENTVIRHLLTDSRSLYSAPDTLFFAIHTATDDGHRFIENLYQRGVRAFVVESLPNNINQFPDCAFLVVDNSIEALRQIGSLGRENADTVLSITGSRGKTTLKEWIFQMMWPLKEIARSPRSYNSKIGVPLSLWEIEPHTDLGIIEAGISRKGEMTPLSKIIRPDTVIITNVGDAHSEGFADRQEKIREKLQLADCDKTRLLIFPADDSDIRQEALRISANHQNLNLLGWSLHNSEMPLFATVNDLPEGMKHISYTFRPLDGSTPLKGDFIAPLESASDIENGMNTLAFMLSQGVDRQTIGNRFTNLQKLGTRLNVLEGVNGCRLIRDSYTADLSSLIPAIDFMRRRMTPGTSSTVIMSDLLHESNKDDSIYEQIAAALKAGGITRFIGVGEGLSAHRDCFSGSSLFFRSTDELLENLTPSDFNSETILIKGAPGTGFEKIQEQLEARTHETVLEVNLDSIIRNYNYFRSHVPAGTGIVAMVKASGYGAGSYEIAKTMQDCGAAYLAVAVLDEGIELRRNGITMPIMVMNPQVANYRQMFANRLEPEIYSMQMLHDVIREAHKNNVSDYPVHLKLDTGMHRMGFVESELDEVIDILSECNEIKVSSVFSHLATADCPDMDDYTLMQLNLFDRLTERLKSNLPYPIRRHILNSAGILRFSDYHYDMVRLGIGLYGVNTLPPEMEKPLAVVSTLRTVIIAIRNWKAGESIGYGRRTILQRDSRVATIPIGYADGMNRHFGRGAISVRVNGKDAPTLGNICMDACMIDVTDIDCKPGDSVEIFGQEASVDRLADTLDTIPYEILTSVSPRVKRVYYRE